MGKLPVDGIHNRKGFPADEDGPSEVRRAEGRERVEQHRPALLPARQEPLPGVGIVDNEFLIAAAVRLLAIGGQEVPPAPEQVSRDMLHDDGDGIVALARTLEKAVGCIWAMALSARLFNRRNSRTAIDR